MKALILNSGMGSRMGVLTAEQPKCMTEISGKETILSRQLRQLAEAGIDEVVMTTGLFDGILVNYCQSLDLSIRFTFVNNPLYRETNYIYSIYCAREHLDDDIVLMHGDLVFENTVIDALLAGESSCMAVSSTLPVSYTHLYGGRRTRSMWWSWIDSTRRPRRCGSTGRRRAPWALRPTGCR